jgi:putative membrane protein
MKRPHCSVLCSAINVPAGGVRKSLSVGQMVGRCPADATGIFPRSEATVTNSTYLSMKLKPLFYTLALGAAVGLSQSAFAATHHKLSADAVFAKKASAGGLTEVELGKIAQQNGDSQDVKDFGAQMVTDHSKINDNLQAVATKDSLMIADKPNEEQQALIDKLNKETGKAFDTAYIHAMLKAHIGDKAAFAMEASGGNNADLKQFASDSLTVIKQHLGMIQEIAGTHGLAGGKHKSSMAMGGTMVPASAGDPGEGKSGLAPGSNANPASGMAPSGDRMAPGTPPATGDAGQSKSGLAPGSNANPNGQ